MYKLYIWIIILFFSSCNLVQPYYLSLNNTKQKKYALLPLDTITQSEKGIYSINSKDFLSEIEMDSANFKLVIFFTNWCPGSEEFLPPFLNSLKKSENKPRTFFISPNDWVYKYEYINYAKKINLNRPVYLLDVYKYGEKRNPHYRMHKFISEICTGCEEVSGFPSLILFDRRNEVVYKHTGAVSFDTIAEVMKGTRNP